MLEWRLTRCPFLFGNELELRILDNETRSFADNILLRGAKPGESIPAVARLEPQSAQALMDSLWDCGIRPALGHGSAGQLEAVQKHLHDMKQIAFHALKIKGAS